MKSKTIIFKSLAIVVALLGTVLSINASLAPGQAHLSYVTIGGTGFCTTLCNNPYTVPGPAICKVRISVNGVPTVVTVWNHRATAGACLTRITQPTDVIRECLVNKTIPPEAKIIN